ncbi:MAG: hypothetical protein ACLTXE_21680 [Enterocloster aldenensis]
MSLVSELKTIADYNPTAYVNNSEPDLDAEHLNKTEQALKRVTDAANDAINALKELEEQKLSLNAIVQTESTATDKVPSSAYLKQALGTINSNLGSKANADTVSGLSADLNNVKESLSPLKTNLVGDINNNTVGVVNIVAWDSNTTSTPKSTGNTGYGNGFCLTYSLGDQWLCQLAMAVGDSHLFTRHRRESIWSGWTTIGTPSN